VADGWVHAWVETSDGFLRLDAPLTSLCPGAAQLRDRLCAAAAAGGVAFSLGGWLTLRWLSRNLAELASGASIIAQGEYRKRLGRFDCREMDALAGAVNAIAAGAEERILAVTADRGRESEVRAR